MGQVGRHQQERRGGHRLGRLEVAAEVGRVVAGPVPDVGVDGAGRSLYGDAGYAPASAAAVFGARVSFDVARNLEVRLETALQGSATDVGASATAALVWWFSRRVGLQLGVTGYVGTNWERDVFATDPIAEFAREDALIRAMEGEDEGDASDVIRALFLTAVRLVGR